MHLFGRLCMIARQSLLDRVSGLNRCGHVWNWNLVKMYMHYFRFFNCIFYQVPFVQHSCSSMQYCDSVLPSIVETTD